MTTKQLTESKAALAELQTLAPGVEWHVTYNYYTKLPEFSAIKDGGVKFDMYKRERRQIVTNEYGVTYPRYTGEKYVELSATYDYSTRDTGNMIVSGAHSWNELPKAEVKKEIPRVSFKQYLDFVKANLGMLEKIGA
jgi:hypothetical protein